ncbi:MAG: site-specific integrase [Proteobacteria bacterium]|nr:site-specific integrase [Pseudomonadota bacterium]
MGAQTRRAPAYLVKHRHTFYFRVAVPVDLRPRLGKTEFRRSLKTASLTEARIKAKRASVAMDEIFSLLRRKGDIMSTVSDAEIKKFADDWLTQALDAYEERRLKRPEPWTREDLDQYLSDLENGRKTFSELLRLGDYLKVSPMVHDFFKARGVDDVDTNSLEFRKLCAELLKVTIKAFDIEKQRAQGIYDDEYVSRPPQAPAPLVTPAVKLSQALDSYIQDKKRHGQWTGRTEGDLVPMLQLIVDVVGDIDITSLSKEHLRSYKKAVEKLPSRRTVKPKYKDKSLSEILAMNIPDEDKLSTKTVSQYFTVANSFLSWLSNQYDGVSDKLTEILKVKTASQDQSQRDVFSPENLKKIFHSDDYLKDTFDKSYKFWVPILGLLTGMRLEEICQLHLEDIKKVDKVWCFDISEKGDRTVKTPSARRLVPLHPVLVKDLNLPGWVNKLNKQGKTRLFPELKPQSGRYSHYTSRWFNGKYLDKVGVKTADSKLVFHSFRHTFINTCKRAGVDEKKVAQLVGHKEAQTSLTYNHYGKKYTPDILYKDIMLNLDFGVDLSGLKSSKYVVK